MQFYIQIKAIPVGLEAHDFGVKIHHVGIVCCEKTDGVTR